MNQRKEPSLFSDAADVSVATVDPAISEAIKSTVAALIGSLADNRLTEAMTGRKTQTETCQSRGENDAFFRENGKPSATHVHKFSLYCYADF